MDGPALMNTPRRPIRVMLVDADALMRTLLARIIQAQGVDVVAQASDGDEVTSAVLAHRPDVVLMDIRMARMSGIEATVALRALPNPPGVIALTSFVSEAAILDAVAAGAAGFLAKDAAPEEIVQAVRQVAAGDGALSPRAARVMVASVQAAGHDATRIEARRRLTGLSQREFEVAAALIDGLSNAEIAERLYVSEGTVKTHLVAALAKTGAENRVQLAVLASQAR